MIDTIADYERINRKREGRSLLLKLVDWICLLIIMTALLIIIVLGSFAIAEFAIKTKLLREVIGTEIELKDTLLKLIMIREGIPSSGFLIFPPSDTLEIVIQITDSINTVDGNFRRED